MTQFWIILVISVASALFTGLLRKYALAKNLMDIPNNRSSHTVPAPRGGGISIVVCFLIGLAFYAYNHIISNEVFIALLVAGGGVAVIGFVDDHGHIAARWRLLGHFFVSSWLVFWLGGLPLLTMFGFSVDLSWVGHLLAVITWSGF